MVRGDADHSPVRRAGIYIRVSTEDQAKHGYSMGAQLESCVERARASGAADVEVYQDEGVSGSLLVRPGLDRLRAAVREGHVDLVVVWDPDRLARNLSHQLLVTEEIERAHVRLEFVNFEWRQTAEGQLFYALRGAIAQYEKEKIKERTTRGRLQKAKSGRLPTAFRPYGYDYNAETALLVPAAHEAHIVRLIFAWFVDAGEGPRQIADRLNDLGVPAKKGGAWHRSVVRQLLQNPVYTGRFFANRWDTSNCSLNRHRPRSERRSPSLRTQDEWIPVDVPLLIEDEVWARAQTRLSHARRLWAGKPRVEYLLSGLVWCQVCGRPMSGFVSRDWGRTRRKYTCRQSGGRGGCGQALYADQLEEGIWRAACESFVPWQELMTVPSGGANEAEALELALMHAERGRSGIIAALERGVLEAEEASEALKRIQERLATLQREAERLRSLSTSSSPIAVDAYLSALRAESRRKVLRALISRADAGPGGVVVSLFVPDSPGIAADLQVR